MARETDEKVNSRVRQIYEPVREFPSEKGSGKDDHFVGLVYTVRKHLNRLRALHGLPAMTRDELFAEIMAEASDLQSDPDR